MQSTAWLRKVPAILIVDDDRDIREGLADILGLAGYLVRTAANGKVALEEAQESWPDLIILDLMMPVMNGWKFLEAQRRHPRLASIPVIVASASTASQVEGAAVLLRKPFDVDTLLAIVARICGGERERLGWMSEIAAPGLGN
ncbi:MAG TPA: response regulator [Anaeromyxobacteraceae bacterium]